jgi:N-acetylmuramoyl-L-alanine amidase
MLSNNEGGCGRLSRYHRAAIAGALLFTLALIGAQGVPPPSVSQGQTQSPTTAPTQAGQPSPNRTLPIQAQPPAQPVVTPPKPLIMIDPAHGGTESGAVLNPMILEKDVTLALARRLRLDLGARGFVAELVRDSDINLSTDERAAKANAAHPMLYVCVHATSESSGIGIYTAMLAERRDQRAVRRLEHSAIFVFAGQPRGAARNCGRNPEKRNVRAFSHRSVAASR